MPVLPVTAHAHPTQLLTPAMAGLLARIRRAQRVPFHAMTAVEARAAYAKAAEVLEPPRAPLARVQEVVVPANDGTPLPARLYAPSLDRLPVLLYLHGGGFTIGGLETHDSLCRQLALRSGGAVLALDYRLAPEHRFPTAVDDSWAALRWLAGPGATELGLDGTRLAVGGDSAGGTLAAVAAIHARDTGLPLALQLLITPGTTAHQDTPSHRCSPTASCWTRWPSTGSSTTTSTTTTAATGALRRWRPTTWSAWPLPACCWPSATRWSTKAWPMPTGCVPPACRCNWNWRAG